MAKESNPAMMIAALAVSVAISIGLLLLDSSPFAAPTSKMLEDSRIHLSEHYIGGSERTPILRPYQIKLREALQAHARLEYQLERKLYREVLDSLRAERKNEVVGVTGVAHGDSPPNDQDLEQHLNILLRAK